MTTARASLALALALALPLALAGCGGPLVGADITEPKLCLALLSETVPAAPAIPPGVTVPPQTVTWSGDLDVGSAIPGLDKPGAVTGTINALSLTATANPPTTDLSSITGATVTVTDASGTVVQFMHYTRPQTGASSSQIDMTLDQDLNLLHELQGNNLHYSISFTGYPPTSAWTADIETCLSAHLTIDALKAMK